jgi:hypothetical protein
MSILERNVPRPPPATGPSERLRVITAGRVGNMEARLGTSGFDVIAIADNEDDLVIAIAADEPDAIVVEADLCESLEHIHDLAPDAVLIVVGDRTPAGALGRIERGVSGTVMAGLLHALVAEGVGAAVVWGLVPATRPPSVLPGTEHVTGSLLAAKAHLVGEHIGKVVRGNGGLVAAATTAAVSVAATVALVATPPKTRANVETPSTPPPTVQVVEPQPGGLVAPSPGPSDRRPRDRKADHRFDGAAGHHPSSDAGAVQGEPPADHPGPPAGHTPPGHDPSPPPNDGDPAVYPPHPPGVANGWDHRPPKHPDNGNHTGWSTNEDKHRPVAS